MKVHQIMANGVIAANIIFLISSPLQAQNIKAISDCNATLESAKNKIQKNRRVKVVNIYKLNITEDYKLYPKNRPHSYTFALKGAATESILNSDKFLTSISRDIINQCPSISIVEFGFKNSDYMVTYGLLDNKQIKYFDCINNNDYYQTQQNQKLPWGFVFCL